MHKFRVFFNLSQQHHLPRLRELPSLEPVHVDTARDRAAGLVATVPDHRVRARVHHIVYQHTYQPPRHVVDRELNGTSITNAEPDRRARIERIWVVLVESVRARDRIDIGIRDHIAEIRSDDDIRVRDTDGMRGIAAVAPFDEVVVGAVIPLRGDGTYLDLCP